MTQALDHIVMTGAGLVTSLGLDREATWQAVSEGRCGIGPLSAVESTLEPDKGGGQVIDFDSDGEASQPREVQFLRRAIREATRDAGIEATLPCEPERCAVLMGTTLHGMRHGGDFLRSGDFSSLDVFLAGTTLGAAAEDLAATGLSGTTCSACSSGLASVTMACTLLQLGEADLVIAGGYDPISEYSYSGFNAMRLVSATSLRPFSKTRDGLKVAEGYAVVVLERATDADARHAHPLARLMGYGESCDAYHLSKPHPEGAGAAAAMRGALASAGLLPSDIDMLVAHATATPNNDASEHAAMKQVFGEKLKDIPVVGFKSHLGHSLGAAGTIDLILGALAIRDNAVPRAADTYSGEIEFDDIRYGSDQRSHHTLRHVLTTSLGFGGANASVVVGAPQQSANMRHLDFPPRPVRAPVEEPRVLITGVGVVLPGAIGVEAYEQLLKTNRPSSLETQSGGFPAEQYEHLIRARRTRRMAGYAKLCLAATSDACRDARIEDAPLFGETCSAVVGTTHGAAGFCETYYRQIVEEGVDAANPALFAEGVPNVASAHLSTNFALQGFCQTLIGTRTAGLEALSFAAARIRAGEWDRAMVSAVDECNGTIIQAYKRYASNRRFLIASGAVTFVLESQSSVKRRGAPIRGEVVRVASRTYRGCDVRERIAQVGDVIEELGPPDAILMSTDGSMFDRVERVGIRNANRRRPSGTTDFLTWPCGRFPELFSVTPFASLTAALLTSSPLSNESPPLVGVVCSDHNGSMLGAVVKRPCCP